VSFAQQPTATIRTLSRDVLVSGQAAAVGTILQAGDTIQTQVGASVVLELSDGSEIHLGENTQINIADLSQTATGARVSSIKLLAGRLRALLSPGHQQEGSSFTIETPNAQVGVKFSEPDIEVSYNVEKAETVGIAHTIELIATNLLTGETKLVSVGSSVIIIGMMMKVIAGTTAAAIAAGTETAAAGTATGIGKGTMIAIGAGAAAAAGGIAAAAASAGDGGDSETAESIGDLSGIWDFNGSCVAQGCTEDTPCTCPNPPCRFDCGCGIDACDCCAAGATFRVSQAGNTLSGVEIRCFSCYHTLNGVVEGKSVLFTTNSFGIFPAGSSRHISTFEGMLNGNTLQGTFSGSVPWDTPDGRTETATWTGTFTVTIEKE